MKRKLFASIILALFVASTFSAFSQQIDPNNPNTWVLTASDSVLLLEKRNGFKKIVDEQFTKMLDGSKDSKIGSFASLDVSEATGTFKYTSKDSAGNLYTIGASGGTDNGIMTLFTNKTPSSNVSIDFSAHIGKNPKTITFGLKESNIMLMKIRLQRSYYDSVKNELILKHTLDSTKRDLSTKCNEKDTCWSKNNAFLMSYKNMLERQQARILRRKIDSLCSAVNDSIMKLRKLEMKGIKLRWITIGGTFKNNNFKLMDASNNSINNQVTSKSANNVKLTFMLNWYKWRYHGFSTYFNAGAEAIANDNFEDLSKREILDTYTFTNSNQTRELTKKTTVYTGLYRDPHLVLSSFINFYAFLFGNKAAIHLQGDVNFISKNNTDLRFERPIYNSTIGLLLSPIESKNKDNKSVQNVELFIKIKDLFNGLKYENKVEDKTTIGLRFTTPIKFN